MKSDELQQKISQQWGPLSEEATAFRDVARKAIKWEKYEYEKYALGKHDEKTVPKKPAPKSENPHAPNRSDQKMQLPKETDIFRATWAYFMARAAFIFAMWIVLFVVMGLFFWGMYAMIDPPSWSEVQQRNEQHRVIR